MAGMLPPIDSSAFDGDRLRAPGTWIVEFSATWCPPCRVLEPVLAAFGAKHAGSLSIGQIDSDAETELTERFDILSVPTVLVFRDGELVDRFVGALPEAQLARKMAPYLG